MLKHKYKAVRTERDGHKFRSKMEARRYDELLLAQRAGEIVMFMMEVPFRMPGTVYWADFMVFWIDGSVTVEDVKGVITSTFKTKQRMMKQHFPSVEIICITYKRTKK